MSVLALLNHLESSEFQNKSALAEIILQTKTWKGGKK